jgi:cysteine sulfinate desulfinase/cysteine desulfurase-like protein
VLLDIGAATEEAGASIRFGLGRSTQAQDVDFAVERVAAVVDALRPASFPA